MSELKGTDVERNFLNVIDGRGDKLSYLIVFFDTEAGKDSSAINGTYPDLTLMLHIAIENILPILNMTFDDFKGAMDTINTISAKKRKETVTH